MKLVHNRSERIIIIVIIIVISSLFKKEFVTNIKNTFIKLHPPVKDI